MGETTTRAARDKIFAITFKKISQIIENCRLFSNGRRLLRGRFFRFCYNSAAKLLFYSKTRSSWRLSGPRRGVIGRPGTFFCYNFQKSSPNYRKLQVNHSMPLPQRGGKPHRFAILPARIRRFIAKPAVHGAFRAPAGASWGGRARFFAITFNKSTTFIANCMLFSNGRRLLRGRFFRFCYNSGAKLLFYSKTRSSYPIPPPSRGAQLYYFC